MNLPRPFGGTRNVVRPLPMRPGIPVAAIILALHICCILALFSGQALAVKAAPRPVTIRQPDGSKVTIYLRGDEYLHWNEDEAGFAIVLSANKRWWVYAREEMGILLPTNYIVGKVDPLSVGLSKPNIVRMHDAIQQRPMLQQGIKGPQKVSPTGTMRNLVLLVNFLDLTITRSTEAYDSLFNTVGYSFDGAAGSVKDFYTEASYGLLTVQSTVVAAVTLLNGYAYYGANDAYGNDIRPGRMVSQALAALEASGFDFSTMDGDGDGWVDGLTVIHAGGGEEYSGNDANYIWSREDQMSATRTYDGVNMLRYHTEPARRGWDAYPSTQGITRIGVICHENGHFIGLPDLYDYGYDSYGAGNFCLMAGGCWNGDYGTNPAHPSAWCKAKLGWLTPTLVTAGGSYALFPAEMVALSFKLHCGFSGNNEYFLVENRQGVGFDTGLPGTWRGILIWHVDETQSNNNDQTRYLVDLEEASGIQHLELNMSGGDDADYYRSGNNTTFDATTYPNNLSYLGTALSLAIAEVSATGTEMSFMVNVTPSGLGVTILQDTLTLVDQGQMQAYIPFSICNTDDVCSSAYGYNIKSKGHVGAAINTTGTISVPGGTCRDVYGVIDAGSSYACAFDTLTIIVWTGTPVMYDTCVQIIHVVSPEPVPLFTVPVVTILALALILAAAVFMRRRAVSRASGA